MKIGDTLPNGATVLEVDNTKNVVLGSWKRGDRIEYVTWMFDEKGDCYWGIYVDTLEAGVKDFRKRLNRG